ncbi:MAG TPA: hypothetical protein VEI74_07700 [Candidatus Methylomirabilis sp.]|nr:hypothetical protein [Candidatus Methylomirabilis sp.]
MENFYWIMAWWVIVGVIVAVAFGFFSDRNKDNDSLNSTVKHLGDFHRHPVNNMVHARRVQPISHGIKKSA